VIARFFSWVGERQFEDDDTPDPYYDPAAVIEGWLAKHIDPDRGDDMNRSWDW
jgi:hypothetical protein